MSAEGITRRSMLGIAGAAGLTGCSRGGQAKGGPEHPVIAGKTYAFDWVGTDKIPSGHIIDALGVSIGPDTSAPDWPPEAWRKVGVLTVKASDSNPYLAHGMAFIDGHGAVRVGQPKPNEAFRLDALPGDQTKAALRARVGNKALWAVVVGFTQTEDGFWMPHPIATEPNPVVTTVENQAYASGGSVN